MVPALIVGALTAWYLGLRAGIIAAIVTAVALLVAMFIPLPGITLAIYALIIAWSAAVYFLGAKITQRTGQAGKPTTPGWVSGLTGQASSWVHKLIKKS
jgi:flagellar biosynthesis component FlhA